MRTLILGLIIGLAAGYFWGFGDAAAGKPSVAQRVLAKFGVETVKRGNRRIEAAIDSTTR
ncbi:MAG: hypothetical protein ABR499_19900 [Gemmatimonadaceae bacterium]